MTRLTFAAMLREADAAEPVIPMAESRQASGRADAFEPSMARGMLVGAPISLFLWWLLFQLFAALTR